MKISIVFTDGARQIMMTPENDHEEKALKMIHPLDELKVVSKMGSWDLGHSQHVSYNIGKCKGGYYRPFPENDSLMFVIEDKQRSK